MKGLGVMTSVSTTMTAAELSAGQVFDLGTYDVSLDEIVAFASHWDPLPMHVDAAAAEAGPFGEIVGSGSHMLAIMWRLCATGLALRSTIVAGRGISAVRFYRPLRPGVVVGSVAILDLVPRERGDTLVTTRTELRDERDELISSMIGESIWA